MTGAQYIMRMCARRSLPLPGIICCIFSSCTSIACLAQAGFNNTYDVGRSLWFKKIAYYDNNGIAASGIYYNDSSNWQNVVLVVLDTSGQLVRWTEISDALGMSHLTVNDESGLAINQHQSIALPFAYSNRSSFGLALVDSSGSIESIHEYPRDSGSVTSPRDIIEVQDGYLITGWTSKPPLYRTDAFILKTDRDGNYRWLREYGHHIHEENSRTLTLVNSNLIVISGTRYQIENEPNFSHGWVCAIDSLGNMLWEWEADEEEIPNRGIGSMQYDTIKQEWVSVTFIERPTTYPGEDYDVMVPLFVRRDSAMNLISYLEYGPYAISHYIGVLEPSNDGGWIAAGSYTTTTDEYVSPVRSQSGRVLKLSNDGTLEWSVIDTAFFHPELGSRSYLSGVTESPSGSVYAVGWANNYDDLGVYRSFGWLLKITADGCVDTLCTTTSLLEQIQDRQTKVKVYPNPAVDHLIFVIDEGLHNVLTELYDLSGRKIQYQQMQPGTSMLMLEDGRYAPGMYVWRAVDSQGVQVGIGKIFLE